MKVKDAMHKGVDWVNPDTPITELAKLMREHDIGAIPIGENDQLVGMVTDRDIAIRGVALGKGPDTPVREVMSTEQVLYCYEDDELDKVAKNMGDEKVRRLPVVNKEKRLVGIVSIGNIAQREAKAVNKAVKGVTKPGGAHQQ